MAHPSAPWVIQQARQVTWTLAARAEPVRFLIRDRDRKFTTAFDEVFRGQGIEIVRTPFHAPQANGVTERFVRPFFRSVSTGSSSSTEIISIGCAASSLITTTAIAHIEHSF